MSKANPVNISRVRQIVGLIDLTNLNDQCNHAAIEALCTQARTPVGHVAAICIWPAFVPKARALLGQDSVVKISTVVNFPSGDESLETTCALIDKTLDNGVEEIDYVMPYRQLINGNSDLVIDALQTVRKLIPGNVKLKVILESGELGNAILIRSAASIAIDHGADFIKTSTGKVPVNATTEAATIMLDAIASSRKDVGFKAAGGIKSVEDANAYLKLSDERLGPDWANPSHFRFGASSLLQDALVKLDIGSSPSSSDNAGY